VFSTGAVAATTLSIVLAASAQAAYSGRLSVVNLGVLAVCVLTGFDSVSTLPSAFVAWSRCRSGLLRVSEVTSAEPVMPEPAFSSAVPRSKVGLRVRSIDLAPAAGEPLVLRGADLTLRPGARIAIVGPSGCGKSTLLAAALRMLPVDPGSVALTGPDCATDLRDVRAIDVPAAVAGSLQGDHVFDATLRDNLRVVRPSASDAELDVVASRVGLLDLVHALPDSWSTPVGPDGCALSGGQRQRLLVARALLADPKVLVLDEPTAHLDAETERRVLDDLLDATAGRTVLMTTHRTLDAGRVDAVVRVSAEALVGDRPNLGSVLLRLGHSPLRRSRRRSHR
jgi:ABC-type transport system involved in cytochrome bd biosynthesis fused ATPase/permease subunit